MVISIYHISSIFSHGIMISQWCEKILLGSWVANKRRGLMSSWTVMTIRRQAETGEGGFRTPMTGSYSCCLMLYECKKHYSTCIKLSKAVRNPSHSTLSCTIIIIHILKQPPKVSVMTVCLEGGCPWPPQFYVGLYILNSSDIPQLKPSFLQAPTLL